jgi:hypothetical protein
MLSIHFSCSLILLHLSISTQSLSNGWQSQKVLARFPMREGVLRHHWIILDGHFRNGVVERMLLEEWPICKEHREQLCRQAVARKGTHRRAADVG